MVVMLGEVTQRFDCYTVVISEGMILKTGDLRV
jgi:hypothetical protein